ncbi:MAG: carbamoyltransferase HypF [Armatimonadota bacterium]
MSVICYRFRATGEEKMHAGSSLPPLALLPPIWNNVTTMPDAIRTIYAIRLRVRVTGTVQGVGFRPFVYQLAVRHRLAGWVCNTGGGVLIEAEGAEEEMGRFLEGIRREAPPLACVDEVKSVPLPLHGETTFAIHHSEENGSACAVIPPDVATCPDCLADIHNPANRRYRYPFTNCTNCGPRFSIIQGVPYDRPRTTMRDFTMCPDCRAEYEDPANRRFHAQPNACPACGPQLTLDGQGGDVISCAADLLRAGKILAVKGLGGYHLACDARNDAAVITLRTRKGRAGKPFAVMCRDLQEARQVCEVDPASERLLLSPAHPIVLLPVRVGNGIAPAVASGIATLGIMLPYTPLHELLLAECGGPLVMTSGNLNDEPLAFRNDEAQARLGHIADHFLTHNRPIHIGCDDSIARTAPGGTVVLRRARGYVPQPIALPWEAPPIFACGGDLKSAFCLTRGNSALLSQHLGDLEKAATLEHYRQVAEHFCGFFDVQPAAVAHDLHPDYHSTRYARSLDLPLIAVQHHHAHIAACLAEHHLEGPVIGVAFDGTGYGPDGTIWGGEFLVADFLDFRRAARLAPFPLAGGEAAIRRPGRIAQGLLPEAIIPGFSDAEAGVVRAQITRGLNAPHTSSMGRLFDAVSALLGVCTEVTYEGQAAMELETVADREADRIYPYRIERGERLEVDARPLLAALLADLQAGEQTGILAARFHATVAAFTTDVCAQIRSDTGLNTVALSGGVFQNVRLLGMLLGRLSAAGFQVVYHHAVPPNDGGLALGQAAVAARRLQCV